MQDTGFRMQEDAGLGILSFGFGIFLLGLGIVPDFASRSEGFFLHGCRFLLKAG